MEKCIHGPTTFLKLVLSHLYLYCCQGRKVLPSTVKPVQNEMKSRFIHARSRKLAPACLSLGSRRGSNLMRYSSLSSALCISAAQLENLRHSKGSVCPQLSGRSLCVSSCHYLPRWSIWPVGRIGICSPWKYQTQTLELCHLLASNSEIGMCVAPSIEICLYSCINSIGIHGKSNDLFSI